MSLNSGAEKLALACADFEDACRSDDADLAVAFIKVRDAFKDAHKALPSIRNRYARRVA